MSDSHLDLSLLENVRQRGDDVISACPACREEGKDSDRDNLRVYAAGPFNCIAHPKDREHNRRIFALVGVRGEKTLDPLEKRNWRERRARERQRERDVAALQETAKTHRDKIVARWEWCRADVWKATESTVWTVSHLTDRSFSIFQMAGSDRSHFSAVSSMVRPDVARIFGSEFSFLRAVAAC